MLRRKILDAATARACLDAANASGLTRVEWAHANGIDARSLNAWRMTLERPRRSAPAEFRLVELVAEQPAARARYVVRCGDLAIEVDDQFDSDVLRRLLAVVASC